MTQQIDTEKHLGPDPTAAEQAARAQEIAGLLPVLASLDRTATALEQDAAAGQEVTVAQVATYETQAAHARHLVAATGASAQEVTEAEKEHRGDGHKGFTERALDHATHTRTFEPTPPTGQAEATKDRDVDHEDIDL